MEFRECVRACLENAQLMDAFNRTQSAPIERAHLQHYLIDVPDAIDQLDDQQRAELAHFIAFVHTRVWQRMSQMKARLLKTIGRDAEPWDD